MKDYMNEKERNDFILLMGLEGKATQIVDQWSGHDSLTKDEQKWLKTGISYIGKACSSILHRLDKKYARVLKKDIDGSDTLCLPKWKAKMEIERYKKELKEEECIVNRTAFEDLCGQALRWCMDCQCSKEEKKECVLQKVFVELAVPIYSEGQDCPYEIIKDTKYTYRILADKFIKETGSEICPKELEKAFLWYRKNK